MFVFPNGCAFSPLLQIGTVNLRVDVTDVINVLMHATRSVDQIPPKGSETQLRAFLRQAGVDLSEVFHTKSHTNATSNRGTSLFPLLAYHYIHLLL